MQSGIGVVRKSFLMVVSAMFLLAAASLTEAQEASDTVKVEAERLLDTHGKSRIEGAFGLGSGKNHKVGVTTEEEDITISGGGGIGGILTLGYGISSVLDIDLTVGYQSSSLSVPSSGSVAIIENAEGNFAWWPAKIGHIVIFLV